MIESRTISVGRHKLELSFRDGIAPATAYSQLLAENIPEIGGQTVVDLGTGSGFLAIVARLQGAKTVYLLDTYDKAIGLALENAERNGVREGLIHLPIGAEMIPLPKGKRVDLILSNPAQLPLPEAEMENSPFYAGPEGRAMIDPLINEASEKLLPWGRLLMTHNSLANLKKSFALLTSLGFETRIVAEQEIAFRPFIDRDWLDTLGGSSAELYHVRKGIAYERLCILEGIKSDND